MIKSMLGGPGAPLLAQALERHVVVLALARRQGGGLCGEQRMLAAPGEFVDDLGAAAGEVLDKLAREPGQLSGALADFSPFEPEALGHLKAQPRLIDEAGRLGVAVERPRV